jgi:putative DNA primase/helicase
MAALAKWRPENVAAQQDPAMTPRVEFAGFLKSLGCVLSGRHPVMDGKSHRITVEGEKYSANAGSGFYVAHLDGHPAGYAKNNKTGQEENWKAKGYVLDNEDKARLAAEAAAKLRQREAELAQRQERAAQRVAKQLTGLVPATQPTPYMKAKGLGPQPGAFTDKDGRKTYLPAIDANGKQWTMQYVREDGSKRFAKDGRKEGCFHVVGQGLDELATAPVIVIAEGYATAATLRQTLGHAAVSAFDSGNLAPVAQALHRKYPDKPVVIACNDDRHLELTQGVNPGRTKGEEAARLVGGTALLPVFAPGENAWPAGLDPVTPKLFREHQRTGAALSAEQLAALERMKQFTDFNDLSNRSALGRDGIERQVRAAGDSANDRGTQVEQQEVQQQVRQLVQDPVQEQQPKRRRKAATIA